jgi:metal-dependent amidase/aminoacylase/carboxypeptidase family protein
MNGARKVLPLVLFLAAVIGAESSAQDSRSTVNPETPPIEGLIREQAARIVDEMIRIRRDLHSHPEPSGQEARTAELVADRLQAWGLDVRTGVGGHGVVGILRGRTSSPVVAYRADMDAVPGDLAEQVSYKSTTPGMAHSCGHDVHTTVGLGVARVLSSMRDRLQGTVVFIFQPSEENGQGAGRMIADGVLDQPGPAAIFALHVAPTEVGTITSTPGTGLAGVECFTVRMRGGDDLSAAANEVAAFIRVANTVSMPRGPEEFGRLLGAMLDQDDETLSHFVMSNAQVAGNSEEMVVSAMVRAAGEREYGLVRTGLRARLKELESRGVTCDLEADLTIPAMTGDAELGLWAMEPLAGMIGKASTLRAFRPFPFNSEDFAFFLHEVPGVMFWLGASDSRRGVIAVPHSPGFSVDERCIDTGTRAMANVLAQYLATRGVR